MYDVKSVSQPDTIALLGINNCLQIIETGVRWVVLCLSQDGACTDSVENFRDNSLKGGLSNATTWLPLFNPPLFSLVDTFKPGGIITVYRILSPKRVASITYWLSYRSKCSVHWPKARGLTIIDVLSSLEVGEGAGRHKFRCDGSLKCCVVYRLLWQRLTKCETLHFISGYIQ